MITVVLPADLRILAGCESEVELAVEGAPTQRSVLDALEARYPALQGTIRDHATKQRRAFMDFSPFRKIFARIAGRGVAGSGGSGAGTVSGGGGRCGQLRGWW